LERARIDVNVRIEVRGGLRPVVRRDPFVVHAHELFGRDGVLVDGVLDGGNSGFEKVESTSRVLRADGSGESDDEQSEQSSRPRYEKTGRLHASSPSNAETDDSATTP